MGHLITGATGFVGAALVLELLARTDEPIVCLVRPQGSSADERLRRALHAAADAYDAPAAVREAIAARCHAVAGDVEADCSAVALPSMRYHTLWHSAASLKFEDRYAKEIFAVNVEGTARVLGLARRTEVGCFNYMSTAYVSGAAEGQVDEAPCTVETPNNLYEASKIRAEAMVREEPAMGKVIFRPSIVIGHSRTRRATNFTGMYSFLRKLVALNGLMARTDKDLLRSHRLQILASPGSPVDLVPIDRVVSEAVRIAADVRPARGETSFFHLSNPTPPNVAAVIDLMFAELELSPPSYVEKIDSTAWLDEKFNERIGFYRSYIQGHRTFDRSRVRALLGDERHAAYDLSSEVLAGYFRWYLEHLAAERAQLPETR
jgi:nucleoside-diphosphate-sugar epimerase